jgi:hypothetical protein
MEDEEKTARIVKDNNFIDLAFTSIVYIIVIHYKSGLISILCPSMK